VASVRRTWLPISVEARGGHRARATLIHVGLQQAAQQCAAFNLQQRFEFAVGPLVDLRRVQVRDEISAMLVGSGVDVGDWQGMSDSPGWHHQSSCVGRQGYDAPSLPQTPCYCTVIWPTACFPATVPKEPHPINVRVDLGYLGIKTDYTGDRIDIPTKKPRKSKKNPTPQLSEEHKAANTALSQVRICIEHAIGGMKRYNILVHVFRNRKADFEDAAIGICAGLWNFALSY
jgi:DDE superfamily endonuclease